MKIESHLDKFGRLSALRARLDPTDDFELWLWSTITAGTNAYNACLHQAGLTADDQVFSTLPGMYAVPLPEGGYAYELRDLGDVSHVNWPPVDGPVPADIRLMEHAMESIERHRDPCLRGGERPSTTIVDVCDTAFHQVGDVLAARCAEEPA